MKKKILFFISFLLILVLAIGCSEDVVTPVIEEPPVVVPKKFTVEVIQKTTEGSKISPVGISEIQEGKDFTLFITKEAGYKDSLTINGGVISFLEDKLTFKVYNNVKVEFSSEKTLVWYFIKNPWIETNWRRRFLSAPEGSPWEIDISDKDPDFAAWEYRFYKDGSLEVYFEGKIIGNNIYYTVKGDSLIYGGMRHRIMKIDEKEIILRNSSPYWGENGRDPSRDMLVERVLIPK